MNIWEKLTKFVVMIKYVSILPIVIYLAFVWHKYGIQKSISESYYKLTRNQKPLFFFALVGTSLLMITSAIINSNSTVADIIIFLAGSGICYTGAAAGFKESKITSTVHVFGAVSGYILGYIWLIWVYRLDSIFLIIPSLLVMWVIYKYEERKVNKYIMYDVIGYIRTKKLENNYVWWGEIVGLVTIWIGVFLK